VLLYVLCGITYTVSVWLLGALGSASSFRDGFEHALFFGTFFAVVSFPLIVLMQWGIARLHKLRRQHPDALSALEPLPTVVAVLLLSLLTRHELAKEPRFEGFVASPRPASVTDLRCWHRATFGERTRMYYFRIDPRDFDKLLAARDYGKEHDPEGFEPYLWPLPASFPAPAQPLTYRYTWHGGDMEAGASKVLCTNDEHDTVYFFYDSW
jgi:hypothetical protein